VGCGNTNHTAEAVRRCFCLRARNSAVCSRWHFKQSERMLERSHSPPPSMTGTMWSASHKLLRLPWPHSAKAFNRPVPRKRLMRRNSARQSSPQTAQMPRSRWSTRSRRWPGLLRSLHSSTHQSEQKVSRPSGTSRLHQRQRHLPCGPFGRVSRSARPPGITRCVLTKTEYPGNVLLFG
jgi:hypothetical protein